MGVQVVAASELPPRVGAGRRPARPRRQPRRPPAAARRRLRRHLHRPALQHRARAAPPDAARGGRRRRAIAPASPGAATAPRRSATLAYADAFEDYVGFLAPRLRHARRLLAEHGTLYVHLDPRESHYVKVHLDDALRPRVLPQRDRVGLRLRGQDAPALAGQARHDPRLRQGSRRLPLRRRRGGARALHGARRSWGPRRRPAASASPTRGFTPSCRPTAREKTGYPTQKPEGVVRRMVAASSRPGGWCLDFFAGSGTLGAVARELGRRFVLVDCHPDAIEVASRRLATSAGARARARPRA